MEDGHRTEFQIPWSRFLPPSCPHSRRLAATCPRSPTRESVKRIVEKLSTMLSRTRESESGKMARDKNVHGVACMLNSSDEARVESFCLLASLLLQSWKSQRKRDAFYKLVVGGEGELVTRRSVALTWSNRLSSESESNGSSASIAHNKHTQAPISALTKVKVAARVWVKGRTYRVRTRFVREGIRLDLGSKWTKCDSRLPYHSREHLRCLSPDYYFPSMGRYLCGLNFQPVKERKRRSE